MFTIGQFSRITGLTVKTLRFYHEKGLLAPAAVDPGTGYRFYDERCLETARVIIALRELEFSLEDIAEILADCREDEDLRAFLERQMTSIDQRIARLSMALGQIDRLIQQDRDARAEEDANASSGEIVERVLEPMLIAGVRMNGRYCDCGKGFALLGKRLGRHVAGQPFCLYYDGEYRDGDADFEPCMPIRREVSLDGISVRQLPGGRSVTLLHRGPYGELGRSYARAIRYAKKHGYEVQLPTREVYLKGPGMIFRGNPAKYLTEIQLVTSP